MKMLLTTVIVLVSAVQLWAQAQVVTGAMEIRHFFRDDSTIDLQMLPASTLTPLPLDWRPTRELPEFLVQIEASRTRSQGTDVSTLFPFPPLPLADSLDNVIAPSPLPVFDIGNADLPEFTLISATNLPVIPPTTTTYTGDFSGAGIVSMNGGEVIQRQPSPVLPPTDFQFQLNQGGIHPSPAPEPETLALFGLGVTAISIWRRK